jgi:hypothetical protein
MLVCIDFESRQVFSLEPDELDRSTLEIAIQDISVKFREHCSRQAPLTFFQQISIAAPAQHGLNQVKQTPRLTGGVEDTLSSTRSGL